MGIALHPDLDPVHRPEDWDRLYRREDAERLPWTVLDLDPDVAAALERVNLAGRVLDLGTGLGTQAIALARRGLSVVGTDISHAAVAAARDRAAREGVDVDFRQDDILVSLLDGGFDAILDRGCFHAIDPASREEYDAAIRRLLQPAGWLFLKVFSYMEEGADGPYRFTRAEICQHFEPSFEVVAIADTVFQGTVDPPPQALFCVLRRKG